MPHREIQGSVDLVAYHRSFEPRTLQEGRTVIKLQVAFLDTLERSLLVDALVVEGHLRQGFFLLVTVRDGSALVRIHPRSSPEKTAGVKRAVSWLGAWLLSRSEGTTPGKTNLEPAALTEFPSEATQ